MQVIQVTPLIRGTQLETLSYFSSIPYEIGSLLTIPIRRKNQFGIVTECKPVSEKKTDLKSAHYRLRKLPVQKNPPLVPADLRDTAARLSAIYPVSPGAIMYSLLPPDIRNGGRIFTPVEPSAINMDGTPQILTARIDERFLRYQSQIRSTFAQKGSILFVVPTATDVIHAAKSLSVGIEDRVVTISNIQSKKRHDKQLKTLLTASNPVLIVTTPSFAYVERADIATIIVEQSASPQYNSRTRPYLNQVEALKLYATVRKCQIILGDTVPSTEDEVERRQDKYTTYSEEVKRMVFPAPLTLIQQSDKPQVEVPFSLFSPRLTSTILRTLEGNGHVFLYAARRGLAPVVACIDCGYIFRCPDSRSPYSLMKTNKNGEEKRWFVSSTSGRKVPAADVCPDCGSWRLRERGIGIQHIADEWQASHPDTPITILDSTTATTPKKAEKLAESFYKQKSGILIGTQMALPYLFRGVDVSAVVSLDAARSTPSWKADAHLFRLLMRLREISEKEVLAQTRSEPDTFIDHAARGAIEKFYDEEIGLRQLLGYPPFSRFVLLSWSGNKTTIQKADTQLKPFLDSLDLESYTNPHSNEQKVLRHALIKISTDEQEKYSAILTRVKQLPPYVKIEIDPERIV